MNKKLLSLALASALTLPAAVLADMTVYGKAHVSVDSSDDGVENGTFVASNSSRFGVKGSKDLGSGITGLFQFEVGVSTTGEGTNDGNGPGTANNLYSTARDSFAGLQGAFGTLVAGRLGAANTWIYDANLFGDQVGDVGSFTGNTYPGRANGALGYVSPDLGGFSVRVAYIPENSTDPDAESTTGVTLRFSTGGLSLAAHRFDFASVSDDDPSATVVSAGYQFAGGHVIQALVQKNTNESGVADDDRNIVTVGGGIKLGNGMLKAQFTRADESDEGVDNGATMTAVGYDHSLAKGATVYIAYAKVDNDDNASFSATNWGHGKDVGVGAAGEDPSSISVGFIYDF